MTTDKLNQLEVRVHLQIYSCWCQLIKKKLTEIFQNCHHFFLLHMCWVQSRCRCWQGERNSSFVRCVYNYDWVKLYMRHTRCHFAQSTSQRWNCWSERTRGLSQEASPCLQMAKNLAEQRQSSRNLCLPGRDSFNITNYVPELNLKAPICTSIHTNKIKSCLFFLHKTFFLAMKDKNNHRVDKYEIW